MRLELARTQPRRRWRHVVTTCAALSSGLVSSSALAQSFTVFQTRAAFDAAAGDQTLEDFEDAEPPYPTCTSPVDSATDDACFDPGDIVEGVAFAGPPLSIFNGGSEPTGRLLKSESGALLITFQPPVSAVGLQAYTLDGVSTPVDYYATAYDVGGQILGTVSRPFGNFEIFLGLGSATPIATLRVIAYTQVFNHVGIDDVAFSPSLCGNGVAEVGEDCDAAGESAACNADCTAALCGDALLNVSAGEVCDDDGESATCDDDCSVVSCGDENPNQAAGEDCDDGATGGPDCDPDCSLPECEDDVLNAAAGEQCEREGASAVCDDDCTLVACGDGTTNALAGEQCDGGGESASCDDDCTAVDCGDLNVNAAAGEQCDDGEASETCDADCTLAACGDGIINSDAGEQCDDAGESAECDVDCTIAACGDEIVNGEAGEQCDDGEETQRCDVDCTNSLCGDGYVNSTGEDCDDAGESAGCDVDCTYATCGDGVQNDTVGEECDDANDESGDGCSADCRLDGSAQGSGGAGGDGAGGEGTGGDAAQGGGGRDAGTGAAATSAATSAAQGGGASGGLNTAAGTAGVGSGGAGDAADPADDVGCGCRLAGVPSGSGAAALIAAALGSLAARRRCTRPGRRDFKQG